jgi:hypothetical protein
MKAKLILILLLTSMVKMVIAETPGTPVNEQDGIYWKAMTYYQEENYPQALLLFQHLLLKNPENIEINYYTGMCYFNLNRPRIAKWHLSIAAVDNCCRLKILVLTRSDHEDSDFVSYNN